MISIDTMTHPYINLTKCSQDALNKWSKAFMLKKVHIQEN